MEAASPVRLVPRDIRDRALDILTDTFGRRPDMGETLWHRSSVEIGVALCELELTFGIELEVFTEVTPRMTVAELLAIVQAKAEAVAADGRNAGRAVRLYDLASFRAAIGRGPEAEAREADRWPAVPDDPPVFIQPDAARARHARRARLTAALHTVAGGLWGALTAAAYASGVVIGAAAIAAFAHQVLR